MGWVSTAIADEVSTAVTSAWIVPFARAIPSARSRALVMLWPWLPGVAATPTLPSPTLQRHFSFATYCCSAAMCCLGRGAPQMTWYPPGSGAGGGRRAEAPELALLVQPEQAPHRVLGPPDVDAHVVDAADVAQHVDGGARVGARGEDLAAHHLD